jgi:hypothetical protein
MFFARMRVKGKPIRDSPKTQVLFVARLRLGDLKKEERQRAEHARTWAAQLSGGTKANEIFAGQICRHRETVIVCFSRVD